MSVLMTLSDLEIGGMREVKVSSPSIEFSVKETRVVHNA